MFDNKPFILCTAVMILIAVLCGCGKEDTTQIPAEPVAETSPFEEVTEMTEVTFATVEDADNMTEVPAYQETTEVPAFQQPAEESQALENTAETQSSTDATEETAATEEETEVPVVEIPELAPRPDQKYTDFVNVQWYIPDMQVELRYAGADNFTGEQIYNFYDAYLRYGTVCKLMDVCKDLAEQGLYLKIWDAFRPVSAHFKLWETFPDSRYVANPNRGFSSHSRGNTLDVTLVDSYGNELPMPSAYDDFTDAAKRDYKLCSEEERKNALILETAMEKHGFHGYWGEWWHFSDEMQYEVEQMFDPGVISVWYPDCNEFITLRERASVWSEPLNQIPLGSPMIILGLDDKFAMVEYSGQRGYVLLRYIKSEP